MKETKESVVVRLCKLACSLYQKEDFESLDALWNIIDPFFYPLNNPDYSEDTEYLCELVEKLVKFRHFSKPPMSTDDILFEMNEILKKAN